MGCNCNVLPLKYKLEISGGYYINQQANAGVEMPSSYTMVNNPGRPSWDSEEVITDLPRSFGPLQGTGDAFDYADWGDNPADQLNPYLTEAGRLPHVMTMGFLPGTCRPYFQSMRSLIAINIGALRGCSLGGSASQPITGDNCLDPIVFDRVSVGLFSCRWGTMWWDPDPPTVTATPI